MVVGAYTCEESALKGKHSVSQLYRAPTRPAHALSSQFKQQLSNQRRTSSLTVCLGLSRFTFTIQKHLMEARCVPTSQNWNNTTEQ